MSDRPPAQIEQVSPLLRRLLAPNPSPFSHSGTQTYVVGSGEVAVIDPGPDSAEHVEGLLKALRGETIAAIVCTHTHRDHSPAAAAVREATGASIIGCGPLAIEDDGPRSDDSFDFGYAPDQVMVEGDRVTGPGWTLEAVATPGHTSNHLCFALPEEKAFFSGDHVMGWSTTVVSPPDGDMADYMKSLAKLIDRDDATYYPTHGPPVEKPQRLVRNLLAHRRQRENQIMRHVEAGEGTIPQMVGQMYKSIDPRLHGAAGRSVLAHLIDLEARGKIVKDAGRERWKLAA
jgi:glyoxylase-like metal-dependent hydrolase (beta-lactamase superfamily II)